MTSNASQPWISRLAEIAVLFAVFALQGAWPVPDVNEPNYVGKAIHFWNPNWVQGDLFLDSADAHWGFYFALGWMSRWLTPLAMVWTLRVLGWAALAWAWRRLSWAVVPQAGFAVLTGAVFACLVERFHLSGEWVIGGAEAKPFAFALVFLGLEALVRQRWNQMWLLFGAASFLHVLIGGWACVAAAFGWLWVGRQRPPLRSMLWGLAGGLLLALPGLIPALGLDWGVDRDVSARAHLICVFYRLPHHMVLQNFQWMNLDLAGWSLPLPIALLRFVGLLVVWGLLAWAVGERGGGLRLRGFVVGTLLMALVGAVFSLLSYLETDLGASVLRFYWFRLADVAVPLGTALFAGLFIQRLLDTEPRWGRLGLAVAAAIALVNIGLFAWQRAVPTIPRADSKVVRLGGYEAWCDATAWVARSDIPRTARFLTPLDSSTFKWRAERPEVGNRKEMPQDARSVVAWWDTLRDIHGIEGEFADKRYWIASTAELGAGRLKELGRKYQFDYVIAEAPGVMLPPIPSVRDKIPAPEVKLPVVYANKGYVIYRASEGPGP
jgi:hypothetical protein